MPASSRIVVTSATNCSLVRRSAGCRAAYSRTAARTGSSAGSAAGRPRATARCGASGGQALGQRRGDDVAGLEVAVRRGPRRARGRRTARRRRRRTASTWSSTTRSSLLRVAASTCARSASHAGPRTRQRASAAASALEQAHQHEQLGAQLLEVAAGLVLVLQRAAEPEQRDRRRVRVDLDRPAARPERGFMSRPSARPRAAPRGHAAELRLAGVRRVRPGVEAREVPVQRGLGGPVAGGVARRSAGRRSRPGTRPRRTARARRRSPRRCRTVDDVHQPPGVVEHGEPGGLASLPRRGRHRRSTCAQPAVSHRRPLDRRDPRHGRSLTRRAPATRTLAPRPRPDARAAAGPARGRCRPREARPRRAPPPPRPPRRRRRRGRWWSPSCPTAPTWSRRATCWSRSACRAALRAGQVRVTADGRDVTRRFAVREDGRFLGLVTGLDLGRTVLRASAPGARADRAVVGTTRTAGRCSPAADRALPAADGCEQARDVRLPLPLDGPAHDGPPALRPRQPAVGRRHHDHRRGRRRCRSSSAARTASRTATGTPSSRSSSPGSRGGPGRPQAQWNHKLLITHGGDCGASYAPGDPPLAGLLRHARVRARGHAELRHRARARLRGRRRRRSPTPATTAASRWRPSR